MMTFTTFSDKNSILVFSFKEKVLDAIFVFFSAAFFYYVVNADISLGFFETGACPKQII